MTQETPAAPAWGWRELLSANIIMLAAYLVLGSLSLQLALSSGYASPLFPPAGIGLALVVTGGWRMLPGIALGAVLLNVLYNWGGAAPPPEPLLAILAVALGPVAQAALGALAVRRWVDPGIDAGRDVLRFLLLAPVVCLVSASLSLGALHALGLVARPVLATSWVSWWAGDTMGVLLFAPLTWVVCGRPRALWWRRRLLVAVPLLLSAGAFVAIYRQAMVWEWNQHMQAFVLKSQQVGDLMQAQFDEHERFVYALGRALGESGPMMPPDEFSSIARAYLERRPGLIRVHWVAHVSDRQRTAFEAFARANSGPRFTILEPAPDRRLVPARRRPEYYVMLYAEPASERYTLGVDYLSAPVRSETVARALALGKPVASAPMMLFRSGGQGIMVLQAAGRRMAGGQQAGLLGLSLDAPSYVRHALSAAKFSGFAADFADVTDAAAPVALYTGVKHASGADDYRRTLDFGGRRYALRLAPTQAFLQQERGWHSLTVLSGGLLLTGLLGGLMLLISGERARIEARAAASTAQLREREARLQAILDNAGDAIVTVGRDAILIAGNAASGALFGCAPEQLAGRDIEQLLPDAAEDGAALLLRLAQGEEREVELSGRKIDGDVFPLAITVSRVTLPGEDLFVCILRDLSAQQRAQQHIYELAHHDSLTGLENRFSLNLRLDQLLSQARRTGGTVAALFIDLDHFKKINDSHGHQTGDLLLIGAARRMRELLRDVDTIARLGGDEFVIVMQGDLSPAIVTAVALRVVQALAAPYLLEGKWVHSGASVGVALFPADADDGSTLLHHADTALYQAKSKGRGNFQFYSAAMNAVTHERLMLENRLWEALAREEFEVYLQAQVALATGRVIGAEALLRWHHPELGMVEPTRFIPIAEESGMIIPLGEWVLDRVVELLARWRTDGMAGMRLAVNLSARQCDDDTLLPHLDQLLSDNRFDPALLELEITEGAAMQDPERTRALLHQLRERGCKIAIDDFGTGYSSLSYLKLFEIDRIKIDRGFVKDIETDTNDAVIVAATIALAHSLGLSVVAEGVETRAQQRFLRDQLGDEAQGYLFARPMPVAQFCTLVGRTNAC